MTPRPENTNPFMPMPKPDAAYYNALAAAILAPALPGGQDASAREAAGLAVYRNNVRSSLSKALAESFPVVGKLVGEKFFKAMAQEYFKAHPPASPMIRSYGGALPEFIEQFEPAKSVPYLADMARLEIAWLSAYHAADAEPLAAEEILRRCGDDPEAAHPKLHPSLHLLTSLFPIASIWDMNKAENPARQKFEGGQSVLIIRPRRDVRVTAISPGVHAALCALARGGSLGDAASAGLARERALDPQSVFQTLFGNELIIGV